MTVGKLGNQEIIVCACDDGDIVAYYVSAIQAAIEGLEFGISEDESLKRHLRPLLLRNVGRSAWGLATHSNARLIAASCNTHEITVYSFALMDEGAIHGESPGSEVVNTTQLHSRERDSEITLTGHEHNVPNISFLNTESDKEGRYLASTDLKGVILIWDLVQRKALKRISGSPDQTLSLSFKAGWSVICVDTSSACRVKSIQELLGCESADNNKDIVNITSSRMALRDSALNSATIYRRTDSDLEDTSDLEMERSEIAFESANLSSVDPATHTADHEEDIVELLEEESEFWPLEEDDEVDYEDEIENLDWENGTATDTRLSPLEQSFVSAGGEVLNLAPPVNGDSMPWGSTRSRSNEDRAHSPRPTRTQRSLNDLLVSPATLQTRPVFVETPGPMEAATEASFPNTFENSRGLPESFRRATEHPQLQYLSQAIPTSRSEQHEKEKHFSTTSKGLSPPDANIPFAIFHTGLDFANLHRPPFRSPLHKWDSVVTCQDPCHQHPPPRFYWLAPYDRLHLTHHIPDLDVIVTATAVGRAAIFSLTRKAKVHDSTIKGEQQQEELAMRLDWVIPFASQEARRERPPTVLIGIATAPLQGLEKPPYYSPAGTSNGATKRSPKKRWRLFLTYEDHTVLSYELWREGKRKGQDVGVEEGAVF